MCAKVVAVARRLKTGPSLGDPTVDCGAVTMGPGQLARYQVIPPHETVSTAIQSPYSSTKGWIIQWHQALVDDAVKKGARVLCGGYLPAKAATEAGTGGEARRMAAGSFYPPTVLADVPERADIAQHETFGPIMCIIKVSGAGEAGDDEAVRPA
jgi:hypothetical protein